MGATGTPCNLTAGPALTKRGATRERRKLTGYNCEMTDLADLLACPRCAKTPLEFKPRGVHCKACKTDFPLLAGMPWMFAEPDASLAEWRGRLHTALAKLARESESLAAELGSDSLLTETRSRLERYRAAIDEHRGRLAELLAPVGLETRAGSYESYLALRTRLPVDQGLNTYYANIHRDWCWGDEENAASLAEIRSALEGEDSLGRVLVLGAGAGRLAYDLHARLDCTDVTALDFNPLLMLVARVVTAGEALEMYEFPLAPLRDTDDAVLRTLAAPEAAGETFKLVLGDALRPPFTTGAFDTVVTPWLIDIVTDDLGSFAPRVASLLTDGGRWINFGSLAFATPRRAGRYGPAEVAAIVADSGFAPPVTRDAAIPYMCSPASRHGRREIVHTFVATRTGKAPAPERYRALPDWLVTGKSPVPASESFRTQAVSTQIYAFVMSLIDGRRTIEDMAAVLEQRRLMPRDEAVPAIRGFLMRMYDDANRQSL